MKEKSIMLDLKKTNKKILKVLSDRYKDMKLDVTPIQSKILMFIYENKEVESKDIGKWVHTNKSSLSKVLNNLENKDYIVRTSDKVDTRKKIIKLTDKGIKIVKVLYEDAKEISNLLMIGINKDEYDTFKRVLDKVEMNIERMKI